MMFVRLTMTHLLTPDIAPVVELIPSLRFTTVLMNILELTRHRAFILENESDGNDLSSGY